MNVQRLRKVAVLGGGVGAMTAAFQLTENPGWDETFEITVYQRGWRLGGKGASGRNMAEAGRIQEHGLHVWGGYYDNAFRVLDAAYKVADRPEACPIRNIEQAFIATPSAYLADLDGEKSDIFRIDFPQNSEKPGSSDVTLSAASYLKELINGLKQLFGHFKAEAPHLNDLKDQVPVHFVKHFDIVSPQARLSSLHAAAEMANRIPEIGGNQPLQKFNHWLLSAFAKWLSEHGAGQDLDPPARAILAGLAIGVACAKGMLADNILEAGFDSIDDEEWTGWCMRHGAPEWAMRTGVGRCSYDYVFGSLNGDATFENRNVAAGVGMRGLLRLIFTYKGALFYKMNGGMGDIVFSPLYQALKKRGVKFEFFHEVTNLGLDSQGKYVDHIEMNRQVTLIDPSVEYQPFVEVKDLPCWPSEPLFDQLVQGAALKASGADLESIWSGWEPAEKRVLQRHEDFDIVILGISVGALPYMAKELLVAQPEWATMVEAVTTVPTQAMQFWCDKTLEQMQGPGPGAVLTAFHEPLDTWADMSFLIDREDWPDNGPKQISYCCSVFQETTQAPPPGKSDYPQQQLDLMKTMATDWMDGCLTQILPNAAKPDGTFDRSVLHGGLEAQYFRVNLDPSERYVQSPPGSTRTRLAAADGRFVNLFSAGDWLRTGLNAGCVEAAAMGGLQAARAISGVDVSIVGESDLFVSPLAAENAPPPWNKIYAQGFCDGAVVTFPVDAAQAQSLLPSDLVLMEQTTTRPGNHPIAVILTNQKNVRINLFKRGGMNYQECVFVVPFVQFRDPSMGPPGPFMYYPQLNLNAILPTLEGRFFYAFRKFYSRITGGPRDMRVSALLSGREILKADLKQYGPEGHYYDFDKIMTFLPMVRQPILGKTFFGSWICSYLSYDVELGKMCALEGQLTLGAGYLGFGKSKTYTIKSIYQSGIGAFEFSGDWTMTNPLQSSELKHYLQQSRKA